MGAVVGGGVAPTPGELETAGRVIHAEDSEDVLLAVDDGNDGADPEVRGLPRRVRNDRVDVGSRQSLR